MRHDWVVINYQEKNMETADVEVNVDNFKKILDTTNSFKTTNNHETLKPFMPRTTIMSL